MRGEEGEEGTGKGPEAGEGGEMLFPRAVETQRRQKMPMLG